MVARWKNKRVSSPQGKLRKVSSPQGKLRNRLDGGGRKPFSEELEYNLLELLLDRRSIVALGLRVSGILIMKKALVC